MFNIVFQIFSAVKATNTDSMDVLSSLHDRSLTAGYLGCFLRFAIWWSSEMNSFVQKHVT